jgi:hypothetical protein
MTNRTHWPTCISSAAFALLLVASACGDDSSVGSGGTDSGADGTTDASGQDGRGEDGGGEDGGGEDGGGEDGGSEDGGGEDGGGEDGGGEDGGSEDGGSEDGGGEDGGGEDGGGADVPADAGPHDPGDTACQSVEGPGHAAWKRTLVEWRSSDGTSFTEHRAFQVCADVPSIASDGSGLMVAAFQAFEVRTDEDRWDKVGVRLSRDEGESWSALTFIDLVDFPTDSVRPFDPTITYDASSAQWRMYFSMSLGSSLILDDTFCTHSAVSDDGITYTYEEGARFCTDGRAVIDPAVGFLAGTWYYAAPRGAPQDGAFFATSADGVTFTEGDPISSDNNHNWTGNFVATGGNLRFYGAEGLFPAGNFLWWAQTRDGGGNWSDFTRTDVPAGKDPGIVQRNDGAYILLVPTATD